MNKIALGTAQFGMDYGINNKPGMVGPDEVRLILDEAVAAGIDTVDTAYYYGQSEKRIGDFLRKGGRHLKLISKQPVCRHDEVKKFLLESLSRLGARRLYGYLVHSFESYKKDETVWAELEELKAEGKAAKIGFSLYSPFELEYILKKNLAIDMIQVPFSIFDQRFGPYLSELKNRKVEIYARSVFLQGLVFNNPYTLDKYFAKIKDRIEALNSLSARLGMSIASLCVGFVTSNGNIDKAVVGVDSLENLIEITGIAQDIPLPKNIAGELSGLRIDDDDILLPFNWKLSKAKACRTI